MARSVLADMVLVKGNYKDEDAGPKDLNQL